MCVVQGPGVAVVHKVECVDCVRLFGWRVHWFVGLPYRFHRLVIDNVFSLLAGAGF